MWTCFRTEKGEPTHQTRDMKATHRKKGTLIKGRKYWRGQIEDGGREMCICQNPWNTERVRGGNPTG